MANMKIEDYSMHTASRKDAMQHSSLGRQAGRQADPIIEKLGARGPSLFHLLFLLNEDVDKLIKFNYLNFLNKFLEEKS